MKKYNNKDKKLLSEAYDNVSPWVSLANQISTDFVIKKSDIRKALELLERTFGAYYRSDHKSGSPYGKTARQRIMDLYNT